MNSRLRITATVLVFDWGDTLMRDDPTRTDDMYLWPHVEIIAGADDVLRRLSQLHTIAVATSARSEPENVRRALARVSLDRYVTAIFTAQTTHSQKTNPAYWESVRHNLGATSQQITVIGDNFEGDVLTPASIGLNAVWLNERTPEKRTGPAYRTIANLRELLRPGSLT